MMIIDEYDRRAESATEVARDVSDATFSAIMDTYGIDVTIKDGNGRLVMRYVVNSR